MVGCAMPRRPLALSLDLIARAHATLAPDDESALRVLSDDELGSGLARIIARRSAADAPLWVFGYGSLLWSPEFAVAEQRVGTVRGWHRRFCLLQHRFRGSRERPGLVLALEPGGVCKGVAFRLESDEPHAALMPVWRREMRGKGYRARWVGVETERGPVTALTFVADHASERYTGRLDEPAIAETIASGCGHVGPSAEYLFRTVEACEELGIVDRHLRALDVLVAGRLEACQRR